MAGRLADVGQQLRQSGLVQRVNAALDRVRGTTQGALARRGGGGGGARSNPDPWNRRGAREAAQTQLRARAARGRNRVVVRNPRTGRRFAVSQRAAGSAQRLLNENRQTVGRRAR